ncbi:MAG: hypothetical protein HY791_03580 [Deltaproteobacteria bacterium]|nr:hypothetical protein [Deltaproteobacteria bacterium]
MRLLLGAALALLARTALAGPETTHIVLTTELLAEAGEEPWFDGSQLRDAVRAGVEGFVGVRVEWTTDAAFALERCGASAECRLDRLRESGAQVGLDVVVDTRTRPWVFTVQVVAGRSGGVDDELVELPREQESMVLERVRDATRALISKQGLRLGGGLVVECPNAPDSLVLTLSGTGDAVLLGQRVVLEPGPYEVRGIAPDMSGRVEALVRRGETTHVTIELVADESSSGWIWAVLGGAVLVVGGVVAGVIAAGASGGPRGPIEICQAPDRAACE